jgi:hypothetical protein
MALLLACWVCGVVGSEGVQQFEFELKMQEVGIVQAAAGCCFCPAPEMFKAAILRAAMVMSKRSIQKMIWCTESEAISAMQHCGKGLQQKRLALQEGGAADQCSVSKLIQWQRCSCYMLMKRCVVTGSAAVLKAATPRPVVLATPSAHLQGCYAVEGASERPQYHSNVVEQ